MTIVNVKVFDKALGFYPTKVKENINTENIQMAEVSYDKVDVHQEDETTAIFSSGFVNKHIVVARQEEHGLAAALQADNNFKAYKTLDGAAIYIRNGLAKEFVPVGNGFKTGKIVLSNGLKTPVVDFDGSPDDVHFTSTAKKVSVSNGSQNAFCAILKAAVESVKTWKEPKSVIPGNNPFADKDYRKTHKVSFIGTRLECSKV